LTKINRKGKVREMDWVKKFRILTFALIISGALNIGLIAAFGIQAVKGETSFGALASPVSEQKLSNLAFLADLSKLSFKELVAQLTNREQVEEGYAKRDLALSALVSQYHFDIERAIGSGLQRRKIQSSSIELFPGLAEEQFEAVIRFAYKEKWPLNARGLFALLQKHTEDSLEQAFSLTPECYALSVLFQKSGAPQEMKTLVQLAVDGTWELLEQFTKEQAQLLDLTVEKRRRLLLSYLAHHSKTAATLLLKTDSAFALKRFDDAGIVNLLSLLDKNSETDQFCSSLLSSPRSDVVLAEVRKKIGVEGVPLAPAPEVKAARYHTVAEGESLWKISRTYKVPVDEIVKLNGIDKDRLYPGMTLKIPDPGS
jgi:LysM repeat protein